MAEAQMKMAESMAMAEDKNKDRQIKVREMALKEVELEKKYELQEGELQAKIRNINADTLKKHADADKSMAEAAGVMIENSETFKKALDIVSEGAELNEGGELTADYEEDDEDEDDGGQKTGDETKAKE